ncbi:hypothetical protein AB0953_08090 [Streptomyces sp. NPDC046866]|uniref:hypothetical protein n=1 Tax=Streptomyces sp. NPDC046866 TaxID=3154921 RepID=UPI00345355B8
MARHAVPGASSLRSAGLTLSMAGAALAMAAGGAHAGGQGGAQTGELSVPAALSGVVDPITNLKVNPLANTGVDPLTNGLATKVADFPAVGTGMVTGTLTQGPSVGELPEAAVSSLLGPLTGGGR